MQLLVRGAESNHYTDNQHRWLGVALPIRADKGLRKNSTLHLHGLVTAIGCIREAV